MIYYSADILWKSPCGTYAVVRGPFPEGMLRTLTCGSILEASTRRITGSKGLLVRPQTTTKSYAKVMSEHIIEKTNKWGEYAP